VGPLEYLGSSDWFLKFPLLVSSNRDGREPILLAAEAIYSSSSSTMETPPPLDKMTAFDDIVKSLEARSPNHPDSSQRSLLFRNQHTTIIIHGSPSSLTTGDTMPGAKYMRCSFADMLSAEKQQDVTSIVALWKRRQLACIISISVLHLDETGWISERLETSDFHFFGPPDSQYLESTQIAPYTKSTEKVIPTQPGTADASTPVSTSNDTTPFDYLLQTSQVPSNILGSKRDERLATLFHKLGIVLFELGRGDHYRNIFRWKVLPDERAVLGEIEKIQFGRPHVIWSRHV